MDTRSGVPINGTIAPVFKFTQRDLDERRVLFQHLGARFGRVALWVSDGQYFASAELVVRASPPFVNVTPAKDIVVRRGGTVTLDKNSISIETNVVDAGDDDRIIFEVTRAPKAGTLVRDDGETPLELFTRRDLKEGRIEYWSEDTGAVGGTSR